MKKIINASIFGSGLVVIFSCSVLSILLFLEVVMRYIFNSSIIIAEELARTLLIWTGFLGLALALHDGAHVGFNFLEEHLKGLAKKIVQIAINFLMIIFCTVVLLASIIMIPKQINQILPCLRISMAWSYSAIPLSMTVCILRLLYSLICKIKGKKEELKTVRELFKSKGSK